MSWLDDFIAWLSPQTGLRRAAARQALQLGYKNAKRGRLLRSGGVIGSPDYHLEQDDSRRELVLRAQMLQRDNAFADGLLTRATDNVIGRGIKPQAQTQSDKWNTQAEALFNAWANDPEQADVRGMATFWELQRLLYRSLLCDGDVGLVRHRSKALQIVPSQLLASPIGKERDPSFRDGVELDKRGRPKAFHIVDGSDPRIADPRNIKGRTRVGRKDFSFLARRMSATQTRGLPVFAQTEPLFEHIDGLIESVITAARMAACFGLVVKTPFGPENSALTTQIGADGNAYALENFEPGSIKYLEVGEEIDQIKPDHPGTNFSEFMVSMIRILGMQLSMPLELVLLDNSRVNFSSMRGGLLQYYRHARGEQQYLCHHALKPVWNWKIAEFIAQKQLPPRDDAFAVDFVPEGWVWLDPITEAQGALLQLDMGVTTLDEIAKSMGKDLAPILEQRGREIENTRAAGMPEVRSTFTRDPQPAAAPTGDPDDES